MKKILLFIVAVFASFSIAYAQSVVINKVNNTNEGSGGGDFVELLVIKDSLDMRGMIVNYNGPNVSVIKFTNNSIWNNVRSGTLIGLLRPITTADGEEDLDSSDRVLRFNIKNDGTDYIQYILGSTATEFGMLSNSSLIAIKSADDNTPNDYSHVIHAFATGTVPTAAGALKDAWDAITTPKLWCNTNLSAVSGSPLSRFAYPVNATRTIADFNDVTGIGAAGKNHASGERFTLYLGKGYLPNNISYISSLRAKYSNTTFGLNTDAVTAKPAYVDGNVTAFSISPSLPDGLAINATTGVISGTPTAESASTEYTITITSSGVTAETKVNLKVVETVTLPVSLTSFNAKNIATGINLTWKTLSEKNNSHFEILRSQDGVNYQAISPNAIPSKALNGTSNGLLNYSFYDANPIAGTNYYKLNQVDKDGKIQDYLTVANFQLLTDKLSIAAKANESNLNVFINSEFNDFARISVSDISGRIVINNLVKVDKGLNSFVFPSSLPEGVYVASVILKQEKAVRKFIK